MKPTDTLHDQSAKSVTAGSSAPQSTMTRRNFFVIGTFLTGSGAAFHAAAAAPPQSESADKQDVNEDGPTAHQRTYYAKAKF